MLGIIVIISKVQ